ncbi:unnamed protein product [Parnassius apollo]|uniref:(apollo) hypothetical protein n=1 Tax=Parnassius apollo TaxID=110799 RepID=A0A8S3XTP0_PARAO|nr:unnamed protein product [Parnassius apollo]
MTSSHVHTILEALEAVKQDYTCGVCLEMCKKPVTLKSCFHLICEEHFEKLDKCPTCHTRITENEAFKDDRLEACIQSAKELDKLFAPLKMNSSTLQSSKSKVDDSATTDGHTTRSAKTIKFKAEAKEKNKASTKSNKKISKIENVNVASSSKLNKALKKRIDKCETATHVTCPIEVSRAAEPLNEGNNPNPNPNASLLSVASSSKLRWTPLHEVVQNGRLDLVKLLLQHNTLINVPGQGNETPLHEAVRYKHKDIVEELVKHGAHLYARNCKGETPVQLASNDIKKVLEEAAENILQTHGANVTHISELQTEVDFDDIKIHFDTEDDGVCSPNLDVLQGIVYGIWILSSQWITNSTEEKLQPFTKYEVKGVGSNKFNGPKNARYNKYKQLPGLFNGCHFYLHNFITNYEISKSIILNKTILSKLISDADGIVLRRVPNPESIPEAEKLVPYHAKKGGKLYMCSHYIIFKDMYEPMYNMKHIKALPVGWIIECIEKYELCEPE